MVWKGCLFITLIFLLFGTSLYALYQVLSEEETGSVRLMTSGEYSSWMSHETEKVAEVIRQKNNNAPYNQAVSVALEGDIASLSADEALALLVKVYVGKPPLISTLEPEGLKGLTMAHSALISDKIASNDREHQWSILLSCFMRDARSVSNVGASQWKSEIIKRYTKGYFDDQVLKIAIADLSSLNTYELISELELLKSDSSLRTGISPELTVSILDNLLHSTLERQPNMSRVIAKIAASGPEQHSLALYAIHSLLQEESEEWHQELFLSLVSISNDDILTGFLDLTPYENPQFFGLYKSFNPDVLEAIPAHSREMMITKLEDGIITFFEAQAIEDLSRTNYFETDKNSLNYYSDLIASDPREPIHYLERGRILAEEYDDHRQAMEDFNKSIALDRTYSTAYFHRSMSREKLNDIEGSIADYDTVLFYDPDNLYALGNRGIMKHQIGDYMGAITDYSETLALDSTYVDALYGRALSRSYMGDTVGALEDYAGSIALDSYYVNSYINRALINLELQEAGLALDDYLKVLEIKHNHVDGLYGTAYSYYEMDSMARALDYYEQVTVEYPEEVGAFYSLGVIYYDTERYRDAYSFFTKSIFMDSSYSDAFLQRGLTSLNLGDTINACLDWVNAERAGMEEASTYLRTYCKN